MLFYSLSFSAVRLDSVFCCGTQFILRQRYLVDSCDEGSAHRKTSACIREQKRRGHTIMLRAEFELATTMFKRSTAVHALARAAIVIGMR
jgi:hypothetical protein